VIRILERNKLDVERWNQCVQRSAKSDVYALSWFLDIVLPSWKGAVYGDYEFVMPLYRKHKWGIVPVFKTPYFIKELAIYPEENAPVATFVTAFNSEFRKAWFRDVTVSESLYTSLATTAERAQYQVAPAWKLGEFPTKELRKNVDGFELENAELTKELSFTEYREFIERYFPYPVAKNAWPMLEALSHISETQLCGVKTNGILIAVQMTMVSHNTIYFIQNATHSDFRRTRVMPWFMYHLVAQCEGLTKVHFMGSNNETVASFNKKFGASSVPCFRIKN
jgi:hypothetical protein